MGIYKSVASLPRRPETRRFSITIPRRCGEAVIYHPVGGGAHDAPKQGGFPLPSRGVATQVFVVGAIMDRPRTKKYDCAKNGRPKVAPTWVNINYHARPFGFGVCCNETVTHNLVGEGLAPPVILFWSVLQRGGYLPSRRGRRQRRPAKPNGFLPPLGFVTTKRLHTTP